MYCQPSTQLHTTNSSSLAIQKSNLKQYNEHLRKTAFDHFNNDSPKGRVVEIDHASFECAVHAVDCTHPNVCKHGQGHLTRGHGPRGGQGKCLQNGRKRCDIKHLEGDWVGISMPFFGLYQHFMIDWLPVIAMFRSIVPATTGFLVPDHPIYRGILTVLDPTFAARVHWVVGQSTIKVAGKVYVSGIIGNTLFDAATSSKTISLGLDRHIAHMRALHEWTTSIRAQSIEHTMARTIIYHTRRGPVKSGNQTNIHVHGRIVDGAHEAHLIAVLQQAMARHSRKERLVVFSGRDANEDPMSIEAQAALFRTAAIVIGPHSGGMANLVWTMGAITNNHNTNHNHTHSKVSGCDSRVAVLEFLCGPDSKRVQPGCPWEKTFYNLFQATPWIDYHHVLYTSKSNHRKTFVDVDAFERALDVMLGGGQSNHRIV